jgi:glucose/arabinose dehydrogenase
VPSDNPFVGKAGHKPEIFSYGHRNPQGITMHPQTGAVRASEHGPLGGDEVNIILPGRNYGWPLVTFGRNYDGSVITDRPWREGMEQPRFYRVPSIGMTNLLFYTGDRFPMWKGQLIVAGHGAMLIQRVRLEGRGTNERESICHPGAAPTVPRHPAGGRRPALPGQQHVGNAPDTGALFRIEPAD